jgi:hypothetical protein
MGILPIPGLSPLSLTATGTAIFAGAVTGVAFGGIIGAIIAISRLKKAMRD